MGLVIGLIIIAISVCAYPVICATIVMSCKKYQAITTSIILLFTLALYLFACYALEDAFDNWCYSVYVGIVSTPAVLFICTGVEDPFAWPESETIIHNKVTIPLLSFVTSLFFAIEGYLRTTNSLSLHWLLLNHWQTCNSHEYYQYYYDHFNYAGILLLGLSIMSIGFIFVNSMRNDIKQGKTRKKERKILLKKEKDEKESLNLTSKKLNDDYKTLISTSEPSDIDSLIRLYSDFCQVFYSALKNADEKSKISICYESFDNLNLSYNVLKIKTPKKMYYVYPVGIVAKSTMGTYEYIRMEKSTISMYKEERTSSRNYWGDIKPIREVWLHTRQDGSPDLRYKNNKVSWYEYGVIQLNKEIYLHTPYINKAKSVELAFNAMFSRITTMRTQNIHVQKDIVLEKYNATHSTNTTFNSRSITVSSSTEHHTEIKECNPQTLEECFLAIINKHGLDFICKGSLDGVIDNLCSEINISEHKEIIKKMTEANYFDQFSDISMQNDFAFYNASNSFARSHKLNSSKCLFVTQSFVSAIKKYNCSKDSDNNGHTT